MERKNRQKLKDVRTKGVDRRLLALTMVLTLMGLIAVADASSPQAIRTFSDPFYFVKQQLVWAAIGLAAMVIASSIHFRFWRKFATVLFGLTVVLLIAVLIPGVGAKIYGARRWIFIGPAGFQPSEVVKLTMSFFFARLAHDKYPYWSYLVTLGIVVFLIMLQPDLGTTLVVVAVGVSQVFIAGIPILSLVGFGLAGGVLGSMAILTSDYRRQRLMTFFSGTEDPLGASYHIRQILLAIGSGGMFGLGLGQSRQKHLFLPETATDSVFAIIAEEVGFVGSAIIILLLVYFIHRAFLIARNAPDTFSKVLAGGIAAWLATQCFLNISSMVALTPLTGIPLPFFSYGGTSLMMILFSVGILLNISKYAEK